MSLSVVFTVFCVSLVLQSLVYFGLQFEETVMLRTLSLLLSIGYLLTNITQVSFQVSPPLEMLLSASEIVLDIPGSCNAIYQCLMLLPIMAFLNCVIVCIILSSCFPIGVHCTSFPLFLNLMPQKYPITSVVYIKLENKSNLLTANLVYLILSHNM